MKYYRIKIISHIVILFLGTTLKAIAVQGGQDPTLYSIYTPASGDRWIKMKFALNAADGNYHELISHLGRTHLLIEPFTVATNTMPTSHPISKLVVPMLQGTAFINEMALTLLLAPNEFIDIGLMGTLESDINMTVSSVLAPG